MGGSRGQPGAPRAASTCPAPFEDGLTAIVITLFWEEGDSWPSFPMKASLALCCLRVVAGVDAASRSRTALGLWSFGAVELWGCVVGLSKEGVTALGRGQGGTGVQGTVLPEGLAHSAPATPLVSTFPLPSLRSCRSPLPGALFPSLFTSSYFSPNGSPAV